MNDWLQRAAKQHGVISRDQLISDGLSRSAIERLVSPGRLAIVHRGVYRVTGHPASWHSEISAATLVGGRGSVVSHRSAARLWRLRECRSDLIEITTPRRIQRPGIIVHRGDVTHNQRASASGISVTSIHRTLVDLGDVAGRQLVEDAVDDAIDRGLTSAAWLLKEINHMGSRGRRGAALLRTILLEADGERPPSWLERRFTRLLSTSALPPPSREHPCGRYFIDFAWPDVKLGVEVHGAKWHRRAQWQSDLTRHNEITVAGWTLLHETWKRIRDQPDAVLAEVVAKYTERRWDLWRLGPA